MSAFKVGQRVRFVREGSAESRRHVGKEAVILASGCVKGEVTRGAVNVANADYLISIPCDGGGHYLAQSWQLEPILPSGHRSGDYSYTELMDRLKAGEVECV